MDPFVLLGGCTIIGAVVGFIIASKGMGRLFALLAVFLFVLTVWAIWKGQSIPGWDGLGYALVAIFISGPAALGMALGGGIGLYQRRKRRQTAGS